jgi:hypothetical protein
MDATAGTISREGKRTMTDEMIAFRNMLDEEQIKWADASEIGAYPISRTHFSYRNFNWSVIHGYGSYGGICPLTNKDNGLLELMSNAVNDGDPV